MKISVKIPKGKSEQDVVNLQELITLRQINVINIKVTFRMIHIDMGDYADYTSVESYIADCRGVTSAIYQFILGDEDADILDNV
jgi:uncharacterized membrane protein